MIKKKTIGILGGLLLLFGGASAYAGTTWSGIEAPILPGYNGSAYSSWQMKATTGDAGLRMHATQGLQIDVRTKDSSGFVGSWERDIMGGNTYSINSAHPVGSQVQLHFSSNWNSPDTNINYQWRSN